jgi:hypothetical protein
VEEAVLLVCIAVSRAVIIAKFSTGTERGGKRTIEGGQNS